MRAGLLILIFFFNLSDLIIFVVKSLSDLVLIKANIIILGLVWVKLTQNEMVVLIFLDDRVPLTGCIFASDI